MIPVLTFQYSYLNQSPVLPSPHQVERDIVYEIIPHYQRRRLHAKLAQELERSLEEHHVATLSTIAYHWSQACMGHEVGVSAREGRYMVGVARGKTCVSRVGGCLLRAAWGMRCGVKLGGECHSLCCIGHELSEQVCIKELAAWPAWVNEFCGT